VVSLVQETVFIPMLLIGTALMGVNGFAWAIPAGDLTAMLIGLVLQKAYRNKLYASNTTTSIMSLE
jgi:Na+-driven multidrug efflux pump